MSRSTVQRTSLTHLDCEDGISPRGISTALVLFVLQVRHAARSRMLAPHTVLHCSKGTPPLSRAALSRRERLFLPSWIKFKKYGIFPWKILVNVVLVALVTVQVRNLRV